MKPNNFEEELPQDKEVAIVDIVSPKHVFSHSLKVYPGQKVWKYNMAKKKMEEQPLVNAKLVPNPLLPSQTDVRYSVKIEKGCIYVPAINERNAWRKAKVEVLKLLKEYKTKNN